MKLFGKEILARKHEPQELYDFASHGLLRSYTHIGIQDIDMMAISGDDDIAKKYLNEVAARNKVALEGDNKTPKEVYNLESLNDNTYQINCDPEYIEKHVKTLIKKRDLLPVKKHDKRDPYVRAFSGGEMHGRMEIESMIERMLNRLKYTEFKDYYEQFPYTKSAKINELLKKVTNLQSKRVEDFVPDLPAEVVDIMEEYNRITVELCNKKPVYYIIADEKDFEVQDQKRDPILLVQSPFCLEWQVLAAWDEEAIYLGDL
jgi:hypothetical protein